MDSLLHYEQRAIDIYRDTIGENKLYNICMIAGSHIGIKMSPESKAKLSRSLRGNKCALGHKLSPEVRARLSENHKGKKQSPESLAKRSASMKAIMTPERRAAMSAKLIGNKRAVKKDKK